jgi:phosphoglycerate dehydrogenase-like enzyme
MRPLTVLVLADPEDPRMRHLVPPPSGVEFFVGESVERLNRAAREAEAILAWWSGSETLEAALAKAPRVRWVHSSAAGVDRLLSPALAKALSSRDIVLTNSRGVFSGALAEFALGAILFFAKDFARMRRAQAGRRWDPFEVETLGGKTLGVLGYGNIGRASARLARAAGMNVLALRRVPKPLPDDPARAEVLASKLDVVRRSDYLLVAAPLTEETRHMVGEAELAAMKPSLVLINVGRGALVDEAALTSALTRGLLRGAALDVFETEPLPREHPLYGMENVLLSPHCADRTATWLDEAMTCFLDNVGRYQAGEPLCNVVDLELGY